MGVKVHARGLCRLVAAKTALLGLFMASSNAADPIKVGFSMPLTGSLAVTGKPALLATQIWAEDVNASGGLLGRPVELVFYDDQSNSALVPGIYSKLLDVDKVDVPVPGYSTNMTAPFIPTAIA